MDSELLKKGPLAMLLLDNRFQIFHDVLLIAEGQEITANRCILARNSSFFFKQFSTSKPLPPKIEFSTLPYRILKTLIHIIYEIPVDYQSFSTADLISVISHGAKLGVNFPLDSYEFMQAFTSLLDKQAVFTLIKIQELNDYPKLKKLIDDYTGVHVVEMLRNPTSRESLLSASQETIYRWLTRVAQVCKKEKEVEALLEFIVEYRSKDTLCELLRDAKMWIWDPSRRSSFIDPETNSNRHEWKITNIRESLTDDKIPTRWVQGELFDWIVRVDKGNEGKLRIVYHGVGASEYDSTAPPKMPTAGFSPNNGQSANGPYSNGFNHFDESPLCAARFPAAMFGWEVIYRGEHIFKDKPVFICFPRNVQLHWSTTLPLNYDDVMAHDDDITIRLCMCENPLISFILYHFSTDFSSFVVKEDLLNKLPHIEYRCLTSYAFSHSSQNPF